jgi:mono/diheme cytochrome c family protein
MAKTIVGIIVVLLLVGLIPFGLIALSRARPSAARPVHLILDMVEQPRFDTQRENPMFADDRAMRPLIPGVEARRDMIVPSEPLLESPFPRMIDDRQEPYVCPDMASYERLFHGTESPAGGKTDFVTQIPLPVSLDLLRRGRERFNVYCAVCHGLAGYGDGMVARRAAEMQASGAATAAGWVAPTNYHTKDIRDRSVGHLYNTITNGIRTMPAYDKQIGILDRWAIVAYVKALQRSQDAKPEDVPESQRDKYK